MKQTDKIYEVIYSLQEYDFIFQQLASSCIIVPAKIPTCGIGFDKDLLKFIININTDWFESLNFVTQKFVLIHEICHIIFHFFDRIAGRDIAKFNIAQDIVINHLIINSCNINRNELTDWDKYCWIDTVAFTTTPLPDQSSDYYYDLIDMPNNAASLLDGHIGLSDQDIENLLKDMSIETINDLQKFQSKNNRIISSGSGDSYIPDLIEQIIEEKTRNAAWNKISVLLNKETEIDEDIWTRKNYRIGNTKLTLPVAKDIDDKKKAEVYIFLDCSGSCGGLRHTFIKLVNSIPQNKFVIKKYAFTTKVQEIENDRYLKDGGTSFKCIDNFVNSLKQYPKNIFVITDGFADRITPKFPKKWHWILSSRHIHSLPKESHIYTLPNLDKIR